LHHAKELFGTFTQVMSLRLYLWGNKAYIFFYNEDHFCAMYNVRNLRVESKHEYHSPCLQWCIQQEVST
jgi:hypothetical protein